MKKIIILISLVPLLSVSSLVSAALNVFSCEPEWTALVNEIGGERITSYSATTAFQDPHHIEARPSLIAKVRRADLIICSGADLEIGWLPMLLRQASNNKVLPGTLGYFEASSQVVRLDIEEKTDRSMGDIHAQGNPHVHLDPRRILLIAKGLAARLIELDGEGENYYQNRFDEFSQKWQQAINTWQHKAEPLKGSRIIVHHRDWVYLFEWLGIEIAGELEPKPGLPTTAAHLSKLKEKIRVKPAKLIIHTTYQSSRGAKRFSEMTGIPVIELPYTVGGTEQTQDLSGLFNAIIDALVGVK